MADDEGRDESPPEVEPEGEPGETECDRLRAEVERLKAEVEDLRKHSEFLDAMNVVLLTPKGRTDVLAVLMREAARRGVPDPEGGPR